MLDRFYFTTRVLKAGFIISLGCNHINQINSKVDFKPKILAIESILVNIIFEEGAIIYARLKKKIKLKKQTVFSAS